MIHLKIVDPILQSEILFFVCENPDEVIRQARNDYNILLNEEDFKDTRGFFRRLSNEDEVDPKYIWFVWVKDKDLRLIIHDTSHLVFDLLRYHNIEYSKETEEVYCLFLEYYINGFLIAINKDKKSKKTK